MGTLSAKPVQREPRVLLLSRQGEPEKKEGVATCRSGDPRDENPRVSGGSVGGWRYASDTPHNHMRPPGEECQERTALPTPNSVFVLRYSETRPVDLGRCKSPWNRDTRGQQRILGRCAPLANCMIIDSRVALVWKGSLFCLAPEVTAEKIRGFRWKATNSAMHYASRKTKMHQRKIEPGDCRRAEILRHNSEVAHPLFSLSYAFF